MKYKKATPEYVFHCQVPQEKKPLCFLSPTSLPTGVSFLDKLGTHPTIPSLLPPSLLLPHPFIHIVSSPYWHPPPLFIHKHMFTRRWRRPVVQENLSSAAAALSVWGRAGYHVHPNKGSVFRERESSSSALPSLIILPAPRLPQQDKLSRTTCCRRHSGCR